MNILLFDHPFFKSFSKILFNLFIFRTIGNIMTRPYCYKWNFYTLIVKCLFTMNKFSSIYRYKGLIIKGLKRQNIYKCTCLFHYNKPYGSSYKLDRIVSGPLHLTASGKELSITIL